jgi:xanthine dehydrogenase iron-sulfur cluster and FAD-binding subunit A
MGGSTATASSICHRNPVWISVGVKVVVRSVEVAGGVIEVAFLRGRRTKSAVIEKIVVPLNKSDVREVITR